MLLGCSGEQTTEFPNLDRQIPSVASLEPLGGVAYQFASTTEYSLILGAETPESEIVALQSLLAEVTEPYTALTQVAEGGAIRLAVDPLLEREAYSLEVNKRGMRLIAGSTQGLRYALQTLRQSIEPLGRVQSVKMSDAPRFAYRGVMLDVSRHMMSKDFIKQLLSEMARLKLNVFHWHLVDGGGWRLQSDAYPLLTQKAAFRTQSNWDAWWSGGDRRFVDEGTPGAYGGYYTKADIREVVAYAERLGITIMPEIEMPGHSNEIYAAYPEIFCRQDKPLGASDVCIGNEATFTFFERILDEVMELFPSSYIHIGGDEAEMNHWADCSKCQARMRAEGLKDLKELQSYMIRRIERYLISKGRKLVGWDEILMGGLAPEATVMSWRGEAGGIEAAKAGHDVIMTPNGHFYLDYYQSSAPNQPRANSSYVPLRKVFDYNPQPEGLTPQEQKHILGVQANLWTEYANTEEEAEYMLFPRLLAVAERAWSTRPISWADFKQRASSYTDELIARGINAYSLNDVMLETSVPESKTEVRLKVEPERPDVTVHYTTDGTTPLATSPKLDSLTTTDSLRLKIMPYRSGNALWREPKSLRLDRHLGMDATSIAYVYPANERYQAQGVRTLIDGERGTPTYTDKRWLGFTKPLDVTIDLGQLRPVRHIYAQFMQEREHWVFMPKSVEVWISEDAKAWSSLGVLNPKTSETNPRTMFEYFDFYASASTRYVRMLATIDRSPGHFIFTDEIVIQ